MKKLGIVIQGTTFMKSMMPLAIFANSVGVLPVLLLYRFRKGKTHDNLDHDRVYEIMKCMDLKFEAFIVSDENDALRIMRKEKISNVVCQDAQHHGKVFCKTHGLNVFSISVFFDTLHYANRVRLNHINYNHDMLPDAMYFPDKRFENDFKRLMSRDMSCNFISAGSPLFDHSLFIKKTPIDRSVCFLTTLQRLVDKTAQEDLEMFIDYCLKNKIQFIMKTKEKAPWKLKNKKLYSHVKIVKDEIGFPYTSLFLILNTDIHISSYSTSACESEYFEKPCINLGSVEDKRLTYAVNSIKNEYNFNNLFNSQTCITSRSNIIEAYENLLSLKIEDKNNITMVDNNSIRILNDISKRL